MFYTDLNQPAKSSKLLLRILLLYTAGFELIVAQYYYYPQTGPFQAQYDDRQARYYRARRRRPSWTQENFEGLNFRSLIGPPGEPHKGRRVLDRITDWIAGIPIGRPPPPTDSLPRDPPSTPSKASPLSQTRALPRQSTTAGSTSVPTRSQSWRPPPNGFQRFEAFAPTAAVTRQGQSLRVPKDKPQLSFSLDATPSNTQRFSHSRSESVSVEPVESISKILGRSGRAPTRREIRRQLRQQNRRPPAEPDFDPIPPVSQADLNEPLDLDYFEDPRFIPPEHMKPRQYFRQAVVKNEPASHATHQNVVQLPLRREEPQLLRASALIRRG